MLDAVARRVLRGPLDRVAAALDRPWVTPDGLTLAGLVAGLAGAVAAGAQQWAAALVLWLLNRALDGLDGPEYDAHLDAVDFTVDTVAPTAPVITVPAGGSSTSDTTPTISGTAQPNVSVEVFVDGVSVGTTTASGTGSWTLDSTVLPEGEHTATAVATDRAGNISGTSNAVDFTVDRTAPGSPVT